MAAEQSYAIISPQEPPATELPRSLRPRRRYAGRALVGAGLLALSAAAGCSSRASDTPSAATSAPAAEKTWPHGMSENEVPYPGRVALPDETCSDKARGWGLENPQPTIDRNGKLLAVIDARRSVPKQCNYQLDKGAGTYQGASYLSGEVIQPDGSTNIPNGTVVEVVGYSIGQSACNETGASPIWVGYEREPNGQDNWSSVINLGGSPTLDTLQANAIPALPTPYANTVHANC